ncbi:hypothetical protein [Acidovorax sp. Root219]|uniref:hypothetical protein n=1 Tax=Acidovorax sp. Root219 TaxID=1736493 RepID=UPI000A5CD1F0|nr:hypothetical protein [Acidovorax sp. Root219]
MSESFTSIVRRKKIPSPTAKEFTIEKWKLAWEQCKEKDLASENLFNAGLVLSYTLKDLREKIDELYSRPAGASAREMITAYCGLANRDIFITTRATAKKGADLTSLRSANNRMKNELSHVEISNGAVDGLEKAIKQLVLNKVPVGGAKASSDPFHFMVTETNISQLYAMIESYWQALVWDDYKLQLKSQEDLIIYQESTSFSLAYEAGQIRNEKRILALAQQLLDEHFAAPEIRLQSIILYERIGKRKKLVTKTIGDSEKGYQILNVAFVAQQMALEQQFPVDFLNSSLEGRNFTLFDLIEAFRLLFLLAHVSLEAFPHFEKLDTIGKASKFSPTVSLNELTRAITSATGWPHQKATDVIEFLIYDATNKKDLWCHPLVKVDAHNLTYLVASLNSPVLQRVIEHWHGALNIPLKEKGTAFEDYVLEQTNTALEENTVIQDYNKAVSRTLKSAEGTSEQIDLVLRLGKTVLVGDMKSIVTTDSPHSIFRGRERVSQGVSQIKRKAKFFKENIEQSFQALGWKFDPSADYNIISMIVSSNQTLSGVVYDDVPVVDVEILSKYFRDPVVPLMSLGINDHLAWFELYRNSEEVENNIRQYLSTPPQLPLREADFERKEFQLPPLGDSDLKITVSRILKKPQDTHTLLNREYDFPLLKKPNIDDYLKKIDVML